MLFVENLEQIIFQRHQLFDVDELIVISGYVGTKPIEKLQNLPFQSKVVYGMYGSEGIKRTLHNSIVSLQNDIENVNVYYSNLPIHAKCYIWRKRREIIHALIGSANFSAYGLNTPFREILAETSFDTFQPLNSYVDRIFNNSISCLELSLINVTDELFIAGSTCYLSLLGRDGEVQNAAGLNWGQNPSNHTTPNDAYIKVRTQDIREFPELFPPKKSYPLVQDLRGRTQRHNDSIDIIWDDGYIMEGLLEGSQPIDGVIFPKQISSFPSKSELGIYLRTRLNVPLGQPVRRFHLDQYGRNDIAIQKLEEGVYKFDFSIPRQ